MRPNEQRYKKKSKPAKKIKPLKQADEFLFERRMKFFISRAMKFITIVSVVGIIGVSIYLYKSEKYITFFGYFSNLSERAFISQGLRLEQIEVRGTKKVTEVEVLNKINEVLPDLNKTSLAHLPMEDVKKNIELLGWVRAADLTKLFPNKLIINIHEREPKAIWQENNELWLVDEKGNLVSDKIEKEYIKLPVIVSKNPIDTVPEFFNIVNKHDILSQNMVSAVHVGNRRWDIYLKNKIIIKLPEKNVDEAVERLKKLQKRKMVLDRSVKYVDLRLPDRIAVKKLSDSDFIAEKPPISLSSAYTPDSTATKTNTAAKPGEVKSVAPAPAETPPVVPTPSTVQSLETPVVEEPVVAKPSTVEPKSVTAAKNKKPATVSNINSAAEKKPASMAKQPRQKKAKESDDDNTSGGFFKNIDGLIGN